MMNRSSMWIHSRYLSAVSRFDPEDLQTIRDILAGGDALADDPWQLFGFRIAGPVAHRGKKPAEGDSQWIASVFRAVLEERNNVREKVLSGVRMLDALVAKLPVRPDFDAWARAAVYYLEEQLSPEELDLLQSLCLPGPDGRLRPINRRGRWCFGIVNPWPGDMSAEAEVLSRMMVGAENAGVDLTLLSNFGHILNPDTQKQTRDYVNPEDVDFVISTHYDTHKSVDTFYYHTLWNPPEIPLNLGDYPGRVTDNYVMNDDYLIYDDGGMSRHLSCILLNSERDLAGASSLTASFPASAALEPRLDDPKMFYCGMNWERVVNNSNRHEGLFKLLDDTGKVKFFGPEKVAAWGGISPWDGYKCYQYSIPFDGFSILKEINKCGICLVLSSDIHRRAGAATNRTYEACAAGAVIISDDNPFMLKYFSDAALFIRYNKNDPRDTFDQLMEKYRWVIEHKEEALSLARRAQQIFLDNFSLEMQLDRIVCRHGERLAAVKKMLFARDEKKTVLATFVLNTLDPEEAEDLLAPVLDNICNQYYRNIRLAVAADESLAQQAEKICRDRLDTACVAALPLFDFKESRQMTDAQALRELYKRCPHDYFVNLRSEEVWFKDHITTLVRALEDSDAPFAYSGRLFEDRRGYRRIDMFRKFSGATIYFMTCPDWFPVPGQILFRASSHQAFPECMEPYIDGMEHYALMDMLFLREKKKAVFTRRMTLNYIDGKWDERGSVIPVPMQINLIRDAVKYDLPDGGLDKPYFDKTEIMRRIAEFPIKRWIRIRFLRIALRLVPGKSALFRRLSERYGRLTDEFYHYFP